MADLSKLSNEELMSAISQTKPSSSVQSLSDDELMAQIKQTSPSKSIPQQGAEMYGAASVGALKGVGHTALDTGDLVGEILEQFDSTKKLGTGIKNTMQTGRDFLDQESQMELDNPISTAYGKGTGYTAGLILGPSKLASPLKAIAKGVPVAEKLLALIGENIIAGGITAPKEEKIKGMVIGGATGAAFAPATIPAGRAIGNAARLVNEGFDTAQKVNPKYTQDTEIGQAVARENLATKGKVTMQAQLEQDVADQAKQQIDSIIPKGYEKIDDAPTNIMSKDVEAQRIKVDEEVKAAYAPLDATTSTVSISTPGARNVKIQDPKTIQLKVDKIDNDIATLKAKLVKADLPKGQRKTINSVLKQLSKQKMQIQVSQKQQIKEDVLTPKMQEPSSPLDPYLPEPLPEQATFSQLQTYRQQLDKSISSATRSGQPPAILNKLQEIRNTVTKGMEEVAAQNNLTGQLKIADDLYKTKKRPFFTFSQKNDPNEVADVVGSILNSSKFNRQDMDDLVQVLGGGEIGKQKVSWAMLQTAMLKAQKGEQFSINSFNSQINKYAALGLDSKYSTKEYKEIVDGINKMVTVAKAGKHMKVHRWNIYIIGPIIGSLSQTPQGMRWIQTLGSKETTPAMAREMVHKLIERLAVKSFVGISSRTPEQQTEEQ